MTLDLVVRDARLRGARDLTDIGIEQGRIVAVSPNLALEAAEEIDAGGRLVVSGFVDTHFHIGESFYGRDTHRYDYLEPEWDPAGLDDHYRDQPRSFLAYETENQSNVVPVEKKWAWKERRSVDDVADRISEVLSLELMNGVTACRMFIDIDTFAGLTELRGAVEAKRRFEPVMRLQICAFPEEGIFTNPGTQQLMEEAMALGADVVGGQPWLEWSDEACRRHVDLCFELARRHDADLHFLCDDVKSPMARTLEYVADRTIEFGLQGRVSSSHNGALSTYPDAHAAKVMRLIKSADISIVCNSHVFPMGGLPRIGEIVDLGINVAMGEDDLDNFYNPFGRGDPLQWAWSIAHLGGFAHPRGIEQVMDMITSNGARALRLSDYGLSVGDRADLVVLDCEHSQDAIRLDANRAVVIANGQCVARATREQWVWSPH